MPAGDGSAHQAGDAGRAASDGGPAPHGPGAAPRSPAQGSFFPLEPVADAAMTYFYGQLFAMDGEIRAMFPAAMDVQRRRFFRALAQIAAGDGGSGDRAYLSELGRAHRKFGVREEHYGQFRRALLATLRRFAPPAWDHASEQAFLTEFDEATRVMTEAASRDAADSPAWWVATVTATELRAPDIAVLTVEPEEQVRYLPGQHVSVQTPRWPRLWRSYSVANAPRPDGLLRLHVRAVAGGLVSPVLVHQIRPGDPLLLGAPAGTMTADTGSARDVLCLAGGTGLAPIKAIVEAIIGAQPPGRRREIVLYHGARRHRDLYDLADLREMELRYPWLQVIPAVSDEEPGGEVMAGTVVDLAAGATWADRDIYVCGPDAMVLRAVEVLQGRGAPRHLIRYDLGS